MKRLARDGFILILLLLALPVFSQDGMIVTLTDSVTLDSSDTEVLYLGFYSRSGAGTRGISLTAFVPKNNVRLTDHLLITGYVDSLKANTAKDSIYGQIEFLDNDGYVLGSEIFYFDFTNNDSAASIQYLNNITPFNRSSPTLGVSNPTFWIDLSGLMKPVHGLKLTTVHVGIGGSNDSLRVVYNIAQGIKSLKN